jgi:hypothetical protein
MVHRRQLLSGGWWRGRVCSGRCLFEGHSVPLGWRGMRHPQCAELAVILLDAEWKLPLYSATLQLS